MNSNYNLFLYMSKAQAAAATAIAANTFELDFDLYFWMVDCSDILDDQRNQVDNDRKVVKLYREHAQNLLNGVYVAKLLLALRKLSLKKSKKPFSLDPTLGSLKTQNIPAVRKFNWHLIGQELKKFRINLSKDEEKAVVNDQSQSVILKILGKLQQTEEKIQSIIAPPKEPSPEREANSEINYGVTRGLERSIDKHDTIRKADSFVDAVSEYQHILEGDQQEVSLIDYNTPARINKNKATRSLIQLKSTDIDSGVAVQRLQPVASLAQPEFKNDPITELIYEEQTPEDLDKLLLAARKSESSENSLVDPRMSAKLQEAQTAAQFLILSIKLAFQLETDNQATGLLANNNKLLIQLCIQGQKDRKFKNVIQWYWLLQSNLGTLISVLLQDQEQQSVAKVLQIIRAGLYSRSVDAANVACRTFTKLAILMNENPQNSRIIDLSHGFYDWLTMKQVVKQPKQQSPSPQKRKESVSTFGSEEGILAFVHAQNKHDVKFTEQFCAFLIQVGKDRYVELFMQVLKNALQTPAKFIGLIHEIHVTFNLSQNGKQAFLYSGVFEMMVDMCLAIASDNPEFAVDMAMIEDRQVALSCLVEFWKSYPEKFSKRGTEMERRAGEMILSVLKRACRDRMKTTSLQAIAMLSDLLDKFARERNEYAPTIYKTMTFLLIDSYYSLDTRQEIIHALMKLFRENRAIPIGIMCTPYFKQIRMDLERTSVLGYEPEGQGMNTTDFELLAIVTIHSKFTPDLACQVIGIITQVSTRSLIFTRLSLALLMSILARFENNTQIYEHIQLTIKDLLAEIQANDQAKLELYLELLKTNPRAKLRARKRSHALLVGKRNLSMSVDTSLKDLGKNNEGERELFENSDMFEALQNANTNTDSIRQDFDILVLKERQIVNLLTVYVNSGIKVIRDHVRENTVQTFVRIMEQQAVQNKGLIYLMKLFQKEWTSMVSIAKKNITQIRRRQSIQKLNTSVEVTENQTNEGTPLKLPSIKLKKELAGRDQLLTLAKPARGKITRNATQIERDGSLDYIESFDTYSTGKKSKNTLSIRNLGEPVHLPKVRKPRGTTQDSRVRLFDVEQEIARGELDQNDVSTAFDFLAANYKVLDAIYKKYSQISKSKSKSVTFEDIETKSKNALMQLSEIFAFLTDFKVLQHLAHLKREDIMKIVRLINLKAQNKNLGQAWVDRQGFMDFFFQIAWHFHKMEANRPSIFIPVFWSHLKQIAMGSEKPMFQRLFDDPNSTTIGDPELMKELTQRVNEDPNYNLPPGFYKQLTSKVTQTYKAPEYLPESRKIVMELLDDVLNEQFGIHTLANEIDTEPMWVVKVDIYNKQLKKKVKPAYMKRTEQLSIEAYSDYDNSLIDQNSSILSFEPESSTKKKKKKRVAFGPLAYPQNLSKNLKLTLLDLQANDPVNAENAVTCASVLNEMVAAVERGSTTLTPRTRGRILGQQVSAKNLYDRAPRNRYEAMRKQQAVINDQEKNERNIKIQQRQAEIRTQVLTYKLQKTEMQLKKIEDEKNEALRKKLEEAKKNQKKQQFYTELKREFETNRLPALEEQKKKEQEIKQAERSRKRKAKEEALKRIESDVNNMREVFKDQMANRVDKQNEQQRVETSVKRKLSRRNSKLIDRRELRLANRSMDSQDSMGMDPSPSRGRSNLRDTSLKRNASVKQARFEQQTPRMPGTGAKNSAKAVDLMARSPPKRNQSAARQSLKKEISSKDAHNMQQAASPGKQSPLRPRAQGADQYRIPKKEAGRR